MITETITCLNALNRAVGHDTKVENIAIRESHLQSASFIGRKDELAQLQQVLEVAQTDQGAFWLIGGESGVGKSRLLRELRTLALVDGWQVLTGQMVASRGLPFQPWRDIVPPLTLGVELSSLEAQVLHQIAPSLSILLECEIPAPPELQGQAAQQRLGHILIEVLKRQQQPTLLLLEDLHWVRESLAVLKMILNAINDLPGVVLMGSYRHDERPDLPHTLPEAQILILGRFDEAAVSQLSQAILGIHSSTPEIVSLLTQETEGNVFFIVEVMRALVEEAGDFEEVGTLTLPKSILTNGMQHLLRRQLKKVPEGDRPLLQLAAVAGRELDLRIIEALMPNEDVNSWIYRVSETTVLMVQDNQWRFAHDKLRETILADLAMDNQHGFLHQQVAEAIETVYPNNKDYYEALMEHWHQAGNEEKELAYLEPVVEHLIDVTGELDYANELLKRGLRRLTETDPRRIAALNWLAELHIMQRNYASIHDNATQARALAQQYQDYPGLGTSLRLLGVVEMGKGNYQQATQYNQQSLEAWKRVDSKTGMGRAYLNLGVATQYQGYGQQARDYYQQGLALYQLVDDQLGIAKCLTNLGWLALEQGDNDQAERYLLRSLEIKRSMGALHSRIPALSNLSEIARLRGDFEKMIYYAEERLSIAKSTDQPLGTLSSYKTLGNVARLTGDFAKARNYYYQYLELAKTINHYQDYAGAINYLGLVNYQEGAFSEALKLHQQALDLGIKSGNQEEIAMSYVYLGFSLLKVQPEQATTYFCQALEVAIGSQLIPLVLEILIGFAWVLLQNDDPQQACELVGIVQQHPAYHSEAKIWVAAFTPYLQASLSQEAYCKAITVGKTRDFDTIVQELRVAFPADKVDSESIKQ